MASQQNDDLQVEDYSTEDFGIIEEEKWGGDYGAEDGQCVENGKHIRLKGEFKDEEREDD